MTIDEILDAFVHQTGRALWTHITCPTKLAKLGSFNSASSSMVHCDRGLNERLEGLLDADVTHYHGDVTYQCTLLVWRTTGNEGMHAAVLWQVWLPPGLTWVEFLDYWHNAKDS